MAIAFSLTPDGIGAVYTSSDVLTGQDLLDADARLQSELKRNPELRYVLVDHRAIPDQQIDTESLKDLARETQASLERVPEGLVAVVAPSDVLFGLTRIWAALAENPRLHTLVTRSYDEATSWLGQELARMELPFRLGD